MKRIALILFLSLSVLACKSEEKKGKPSEKSPIETPKIEKELVVNISLKTNKKDEFKLMMNNIEIDEFQKKNIHIIEEMEPTTSYETINASFGVNNISKAFNIFLGAKEIKELDVQSIDISYGGNSVSINSSQLNDYFWFNEFVEQDPESMKIRTKKVEGKHHPIIRLRPKVIDQLIKEN